MKIISLSSMNKRKHSQTEPITRTITNNMRRLKMHIVVAIGKLAQQCLKSSLPQNACPLRKWSYMPYKLLRYRCFQEMIFDIGRDGSFSNFLFPETKSPLHVPRKVRMAAFHVRSKVFIVPIHVRRKFADFAPHMD